MNTEVDITPTPIATNNDRNSIGFYHSPSQFRFDTWHELKHNAQRLSRRFDKSANTADYLIKVAEGLRLLETVESYTAV